MKKRRITKPPTIDRPPSTNIQPATTDKRPTTHQQSAPPTHRPLRTDHRPTGKCSTDTLTGPPPTYWSPTHQPTDHQLTDSPTLIQLATNPLVHQTYFNRATIGSILSIINFNSSFGMDTIYLFIYFFNNFILRWYCTIAEANKNQPLITINMVKPFFLFTSCGSRH